MSKKVVKKISKDVTTATDAAATTYNTATELSKKGIGNAKEGFLSSVTILSKNVNKVLPSKNSVNSLLKQRSSTTQEVTKEQ